MGVHNWVSKDRELGAERVSQKISSHSIKKVPFLSAFALLSAG